MRMIRLREVIRAPGLARSTIYKLMGANEFPQSVTLVGNGATVADGSTSRLECVT